jgi:transposase
MRYVELTTQQTGQLTELYKASSSHRERQRAQALLLSSRGFTIPALSDLFEVDRDTITRWFDRWQEWLETRATLCLQDQLRPGRPAELDRDQKKR